MKDPVWFYLQADLLAMERPDREWTLPFLEQVQERAWSWMTPEQREHVRAEMRRRTDAEARPYYFPRS